MRSTRSIEILCLVLAAMVLLWSHALAHSPGPVLALLGSFALAIILFRAKLFLPGLIRTRLLIESWSMVLFITGALWFSGKVQSPLLNLYLLPVILSALTLGRRVTLLQVGIIVIGHVLLALATPGVEILSLEYASLGVGQLAPIFLIAYLTTTLSADITEARQRIEDLAQNDALTGLYNQRKFDEIWKREHAKSAHEGGRYALLMLDLDKLGEINEGFGHEAGNSALNLVAQCLRRSIRTTDHAARFGGDEFALLLPGATPEVAEVVAKRVRHNVYKTTLDVKSRMIRCNVSIGIVNFPQDGQEIRDLLGTAERAMYRDKELRKTPGVAANV